MRCLLRSEVEPVSREKMVNGVSDEGLTEGKLTKIHSFMNGFTLYMKWRIYQKQDLLQKRIPQVESLTLTVRSP